MKEILNWKLVEVLQNIEIINEDEKTFRKQILDDLKIPKIDFYKAINRKETEIDWSKIKPYHNFFFDSSLIEDKISRWFKKSKLADSKKLLIFYYQEGLIIKVPTNLFIDDWEGFFRSSHFETLIFSEDYKLFMEVSRDYTLHSNFKICEDELFIVHR